MSPFGVNNGVHPTLTKEVLKIKHKAETKNLSFTNYPYGLENVALISVGSRPVIIVLMEDKSSSVIYPFKVDMKRWSWAEEEGFKVDSLPEDLAKEILVQLTYPELLTYLNL